MDRLIKQASQEAEAAKKDAEQKKKTEVRGGPAANASPRAPLACALGWGGPGGEARARQISPLLPIPTLPLQSFPQNEIKKKAAEDAAQLAALEAVLQGVVGSGGPGNAGAGMVTPATHPAAELKRAKGGGGGGSGGGSVPDLWGSVLVGGGRSG